MNSNSINRILIFLSKKIENSCHFCTFKDRCVPVQEARNIVAKRGLDSLIYLLAPNVAMMEFMDEHDKFELQNLCTYMSGSFEFPFGLFLGELSDEAKKDLKKFVKELKINPELF